MSIFPFMNNLEIEEVNDELPLFMEYAYDFENNKLLLNELGRTYLLTGNDALKVWIYKALKTERYNYLAYSISYGNEMQTLLGKSIDYEIMKSEMQRFITETLYFNDYIREIKDFTFDRIDAGITVHFEVVSIYGAMEIDYQEGVIS